MTLLTIPKCVTVTAGYCILCVLFERFVRIIIRLLFSSLSGDRVELDAVARLPLQLDDVVGQPLLHLVRLQVAHVHALHEMREPAMNRRLRETGEIHANL